MNLKACQNRDVFGLTKTGANPWDAKLLELSHDGASHGEKCTIRFLLNVWDPEGGWACGKVDLIDAYRVWNEQHRLALFLVGNQTVVALIIRKPGISIGD